MAGAKRLPAERRNLMRVVSRPTVATSLVPKYSRSLDPASAPSRSDHVSPRGFEQCGMKVTGPGTVVNGFGSVRNRTSDAHGQGRKAYRPAERHAALAVNLAGAMALFLMETHKANL